MIEYSHTEHFDLRDHICSDKIDLEFDIDIENDFMSGSLHIEKTINAFDYRVDTEMSIDSAFLITI